MNSNQSLLSSSNISSTILLMEDIKNKLLVSIGILFIVFGTIDNVLNIILFRKRTLWNVSSCIPLLFSISISNLILIYFFVMIRMFIGFKITPTYYSSYSLSSWFMVACCIDRFLSSSHDINIRNYSNMSTTIRIIHVIIISILIIFSPILYCFEANQFNKSTPCFPQNSTCHIFELVVYFIFHGIGPPILMFFFGIGTIKHIYHERHNVQILPIGKRLISEFARKKKKISRDVLRMITIQVILYIIFNMPLFLIKIYASIPLAIVRSSLRLSIENFIANICLMATCVDKVFSFYIYTLSSKYYRKELIQLFTQYWNRQRRETPQN
ncbi:hypothetical protein I4U23_022196 [Adineta vaga]|nr:hypothetical protein I4U23_022196 [Adineta vaga]